MTYEVIILGHLHMPLYFIGTFTEYSFVMHRNLVNFTYPQDKQFSPMLLRGLNLFADRFTRTSVLRVMSHAFWSWYIECLTGLKPNTEIL